MDYAVLFPGQGSQVVGMGETLFADHDDLLGEAADSILGWSLRDACLDGPADHLTRTDVAQPAIYALSFAVWLDWMAAALPSPAAGAGHSLGEYTALAAGGAFDFFTGLEIVAARGRAMAAAAAMVESGMAAVIGADPTVVEKICEGRRDDGGSLWVANLNAPGQIVVAGTAADLDWLSAEAAALGLRRVIALDVAGAFHTPLMEPALAEYAAVLEGIEFSQPRFPIWSNVDAAPYGRDIVGTLLRQLTAPVRFEASLAGMAAAGIGAFFHLGPGDVTMGMARRTVPGTAVAAAADAASVADAASILDPSVE
jgi:[acyl-carrier-protein] S-malonyltransferase